jgi:nitrogenase molybdenum-iron protein NifN
MISQLIVPQVTINPNKLLLLPNVNLTPIEVEKIKESIELFGFEVIALPDISESLDGHLGEKQGSMSAGGVEVSDIELLGDSGIVISIGESMKKCGEKFKEIQPLSQHFHLSSVSGLIDTDNFYKILMGYKNIKTPPPSIIRWRKRLQDALLDTHFLIGSSNIVIADEADKSYALSKALKEAGAKISSVIVPTRSAINVFIESDKVLIGDMEDLENALEDCEVIISNFHAHRIAHKHHKALILRGFPNYEQVGNNMNNDVLYEGSCYLLFELANLIRESRDS